MPVTQDQKRKKGTEVNQGQRAPVLARLIRWGGPVMLIGLGILAAMYLLKTSPQARPRPAKKNRAMVETMVVDQQVHQTSIEAMGVVQAARQIEMRAQVSGQVVTLGPHFLPGGHFAKGELLLQLDAKDYQLNLEQQAQAVAVAENNLAIEEGQQVVVRKEFKLLGESVTAAEKQLILRQPQLRTLKAQLAQARVQLRQAQLNLARTSLQAPFNGIVRERGVNVGSWATTTTSLATLVGSDQYWVEVSVPEEQLPFLTFASGKGTHSSQAQIYNPAAWAENKFRQGRVLRLLPALESQGRMARVLIEVTDPLALQPENQGQPGLLIDSFVRVVIQGRDIPNAILLPREYLRGGNQVWVYGRQDQLEFRRVTVAFRSRAAVLITAGLKSGEEIVVSDISTPVEGLGLKRLADQESTVQSAGRKQEKNRAH